MGYIITSRFGPATWAMFGKRFESSGSLPAEFRTKAEADEALYDLQMRYADYDDAGYRVVKRESKRKTQGRRTRRDPAYNGNPKGLAVGDVVYDRYQPDVVGTITHLENDTIEGREGRALLRLRLSHRTSSTFDERGLVAHGARLRGDQLSVATRMLVRIMPKHVRGTRKVRRDPTSRGRFRDPASLNDLTPDQREALIAYAKEKGRMWKSRLREDWFRADARIRGESSPELQQIRNQRGPRWLNSVRLDPRRDPAKHTAPWSRRELGPTGAVAWHLRAPHTGLFVVWNGPGSRLRMGTRDRLWTIDHPVADDSYSTRAAAEAAIRCFLATFEKR